MCRGAAGHPAVERERRSKLKPRASRSPRAHRVFLLQVGRHTDITEESLSLFHLLEPRIGEQIIPPHVHQRHLLSAVENSCSK